MTYYSSLVFVNEGLKMVIGYEASIEIGNSNKVKNLESSHLKIVLLLQSSVTDSLHVVC